MHALQPSEAYAYQIKVYRTKLKRKKDYLILVALDKLNQKELKVYTAMTRPSRCV